MEYSKGKLKPNRCAKCGCPCVWVPKRGWCCADSDHWEEE